VLLLDGRMEEKRKKKKDLPNIPVVFISSLNGQGIATLKDMIWRILNF
jgi:hypothetical protein